MYYLQKPIKIILKIVIGLVIALAVFSGIHHLLLVFEEPLLVAAGVVYDINNVKLDVYNEGVNLDAPTLVFLSGSGTASPVYDFKPLYSQLSDEYEIAVVEKPGYGYSPATSEQRDIETVVEEMRLALEEAHIPQPYILVPHSMGGLEAQYWAKKYPDEVSGIAGLDMAVPSWYTDGKYDSFGFKASMYIKWFFAQGIGLTRLPFVYPIDNTNLSEYQSDQLRFVTYRQALNSTVLAECNMVTQNALTVQSLGTVDKPILMFTSDGKELGNNWLSCQAAYANESGAELVNLDCGHYVHKYKTDEIAAKMKSWLKGLGY